MFIKERNKVTRAQIILKKWIKTQFTDEVEIQFPTKDTAKIIDIKNETMTITLNIYCDIIEIETKKVLAISDLPHDVMLVGNEIPQSWDAVPYYSA